MQFSFTTKKIAPGIQPRRRITYYETKADLILPLKGRLLVNSVATIFTRTIADLTICIPSLARSASSNFMRYAYDFFMIPTIGVKEICSMARQLRIGLVSACRSITPSSGKVIAASNAYADDFGGKLLSVEKITNDRMLFYNRVVIDHGNSEFSMLGASQAGQRPGETRRIGQSKGQPIAAVGVIRQRRRAAPLRTTQRTRLRC